jgi:type VI secretion system secreted protein Hcp
MVAAKRPASTPLDSLTDDPVFSLVADDRPRGTKPTMSKLLTRVAFILTVLVAAFAWSPDANANPTTAGFMTMKGETQQEIKGGVTTSGFEDSLHVVAISPEINVPFNTSTGQMSGVRQHKPMRVTVKLDKAMPLLMYALVNNENLPEVKIRMVGPSRRGQEQVYYTIELRNATLVGFRIDMDKLRNDPTLRPDLLHLSLVYRQIEIVWSDGGITAMDDWSSLQAASAPTPKEGVSAPMPKSQARPPAPKTSTKPEPRRATPPVKARVRSKQRTK